MPNRLALETSPYLLQHADNPVDWYPWGEQALAMARRENRPILLSVGYSACHWCHVMAHESFEDPEVAALMNRCFVNVKVDREERPDIDHIYQMAHQLLTRRSGGWPLTMFLDPLGRPFYGGTYFPREARYHLPGFAALLARVARAWSEQREDIDRQNDELTRLLAQTVPSPDPDGAMPGPAVIQSVRDALVALVDEVHGGLGGAPKFPHPSEFEFLLHRAAAGDEVAGAAVRRTFAGMAEGGIFDHLAGGFCRYSTDGEWTIPHFEKMLYDNAPLLRLYADVWLLERDPACARVCEETAGWVMREMQTPEGGYASSLDADSEGHEGRFYVWHVDEIRNTLDADAFRIVAMRFGLDRPPNFEGSHWHLRVARSWTEVAAETGYPERHCEAVVDAAKARLLAVRSARVRPDRDDKILTSWNALMIEGMAHAGRVLGRPAWIASARRALAFVRQSLWVDGRLLATHKNGKSHLNAYLDDHAFLLSALLELLQSDFEPAELQFAKDIADTLLARFEDPAGGGFWFTSHDHETLILRTKTGHDEATPAGNGVAARALLRLGHLIGNERYLAAAERTLRAFAPAMTRTPAGHASLAMALEDWIAPPAMVVLRGPAMELPTWTAALGTRYRPGVVVIPLGEASVTGEGILDKPVDDRVNAWLCRAVTCLPPMATSEQLLLALGEENASPDVSTAPQTS